MEQEHATTGGDGPIRVGIVGQGRSGWGIHAGLLSKLPEQYRVVAVMDPWAERVEQSAQALGCRPYRDFGQILADDEIELVVVASPNKFHVEHALAALNAGKHVLCEKPFATRVADVDRMIAAARASGRVVQPFQQRRYEPDFQKVKEVCASGLLGEIKFVRICWHGFKRRWDWQTLSEMAGGDLNNNGPHLIDHALGLIEQLGGEDVAPEDIWCELRHCLASGDAEDHVKVILRGVAGRPTIDIELSSIFVYGQDRWTVCGTSGGLRGDASGLEWKWVDWSTMPERPVTAVPTPDRSYNSEKIVWQTDSWKPSSGAAADAGGGAAPAPGPSQIVYHDLYRSIREGAPQNITPESVRRRVAVIERCHALYPIPD
jgi:predicted dehydrogenase